MLEVMNAETVSASFEKETWVMSLRVLALIQV